MGRAETFELPDTIEAIEYYYEQGLTDGLPVIPPTPERVNLFLESGGVGPEEVLGARSSRNWEITAEKVAINAVMAGCLPEYAPVVIAAVQALLTPDYNASGVAETSGNSAPMLLVNGPARTRLKINCGTNLFGPGWRANATIGRALRLVLINVCGVVPGTTDKSVFGHSGRYTMCIGENEEASPWEPFHVEQGLPLEASAVTLFSVRTPIEVFEQGARSPEELLDTLSHTIAANVVCHGRVIVILSPQHAQEIGPSGWSKARVKDYISRRVNDQRPIVCPDQGQSGSMFGVVFPTLNDYSSTFPTTPENIILMVAGGGSGGMSTILPIWASGFVSKHITRQIMGL